MARIRLDDDYLYHPKFTVLSHGAFRLWHEGMVYCRKLMTDGLIAIADLKTFRYASRACVQELLTPRSPGVAPLWMEDAQGYHVHDYLDWNPSREEEQQDRAATKQRMRAYRGKKRGPPGEVVTPDVTPHVTPEVTAHVTPHVLGQGQGRSSLEKESEKKPLHAVATEARSKRPIFTGQRIVIFEWMLDDIRQILGPYTDDFGLDVWFYELDAQAMRLNLVMPKRDGGAWVQAQLLAEVKRRGLSIAGVNEPDDRVPYAWQCGRCGEIHEGTKEQNRQRVCFKGVSA